MRNNLEPTLAIERALETGTPALCGAGAAAARARQPDLPQENSNNDAPPRAPLFGVALPLASPTSPRTEEEAKRPYWEKSGAGRCGTPSRSCWHIARCAAARAGRRAEPALHGRNITGWDCPLLGRSRLWVPRLGASGGGTAWGFVVFAQRDFP